MGILASAVPAHSVTRSVVGGCTALQAGSRQATTYPSTDG